MNVRTISLIAGLLMGSSVSFADSELPALGDRASGYVSMQQEHDLGRLWLRQLRSQVSSLDDPLVLTYFEDLIYRLVPHSELREMDLEFIVVDSPELNAFAVPGGIIGINDGIFLYANDTDELAAVLAHELAHLSQRHFSRQIENAERRDPIALATLLASILLIATNNPDAGFAGLVTSQAASIQNQLAYSRDFEREADRLGMLTLAGAELDPQAMPSMFEAMLNANRYREAPPEVLLTHPITSSRVADAANRAEQYPARPRLASFEFSVLRNDARRRYQLKDSKAEEQFIQELSRTTGVKNAALHYNLANIYLNNRDPDKGLAQIEQIESPWRQHSATIALEARLLALNGNNDQAIKVLNDALRLNPNDRILVKPYAPLLVEAGRATEASQLLRKQTELYPTEPSAWQQLSNVAYKANQPIVAHRALAEYLYFSGQRSNALKQMDVALLEARKRHDFYQEAALKERLKAMTESPTSLQ